MNLTDWLEVLILTSVGLVGLYVLIAAAYLGMDEMVRLFFG